MFSVQAGFALGGKTFTIEKTATYQVEIYISIIICYVQPSCAQVMVRRVNLSVILSIAS